MDKPIDFTAYRNAKVAVKDLEELLQAVDDCLNRLQPFQKFKIASQAAEVLSNNKPLLEIHYNKYKRILDESKSK